MKKIKNLMMAFIAIAIALPAFAQKVEWVKEASTYSAGNPIEFTKMLNDGNGNIYAYGYFNAPSVYDGITFTPINSSAGSANRNAFIVKLDLNGNIIWKKIVANQLGGSGSSSTTIHDFTFGPSGNLVFLINSSLSFYMDTTNLASGGLFPENVIVRLDTAGNILQSTITTGTPMQYVNNITYKAGNYYVISASKILKLNSSYVLQWSSDLGGTDYFTALSFDSADDLIAIGIDGTGFQGFSLAGVVYTFSQTASNCFYAKINNSNGLAAWVNIVGDGSNAGTFKNVTVDSGNNIYIVGNLPNNGSLFYFGNDTIGNPLLPQGAAFILKADPSGSEVWGRDFYATQGIGFRLREGILLDDSANVYAFPSYNGQPQLEQGQLPFINNSNGSTVNTVCVIKLDSAGTWQYGKAYLDSTAYSAGYITTANIINDTIYAFGYWSIPNKVRLGCYRASESAFFTAISKNVEPVPVAAFDFVIDEGKAFFSNNTLNGGSYNWDFGDGQTSTQVNPLHIYSKGSYTACLTVNDSCGNNQKCNSVIVQGIASISPNKVADIGYHTILIKGGFASAPNSIVFHKAGSADIIPDTVIFSGSGIIQANLKLNSVDTGYYDLYYQSSTLTDTLLLALHIQTSDSILPTVAVSGNSRIRTNTVSVIKIIVTNHSNVTYFGLPVHILANPALNLSLLNSEVSDSIVQQILDTAGTNFFYVHPDSTVSDSLLFGSFLIPKISAGSSFSINLYVSTTNVQQHSIRVFVGNPYFSQSVLQTLGLSRTMSPCNWLPVCLQCALDLAGYIPIVGCGTGTFNLTCAARNEVKKPNFDNLMDLVGNMAGTALGCTGATAAIQALEKSAGALLLTSELSQTFQTSVGVADDCGGDKGCGPGNEDNFNFPAVAAFDPNCKSGPLGNNASNFINKYKELNYTINFENVDTATATVAQAIIVDTLDLSVFDVNTFSFSGFGFSDTLIDFPSPQNYFAQEIDLQPAKNSILRIIGTIDTLSGIIKWTFTSLDPTTRDIITTINDGFLNPNVTSPEGQAFVTYQVKLKESVPHLQTCLNTAHIIFDSNTPITTNTFLNTVDTVKPISSVFILASTSDTIFTVKWQGIDVDAGISSYDLYVSENDSAYYRLFSLTQKDSAILIGTIGSKYEFYTIAHDFAGNIENPPVDPDNFPDAVTTITVGLTEINSNAFMQVVPNPTKNMVTVTMISQVKQDFTVEVLDINGRKIFKHVIVKESNNSPVKINTSTFNNGIYYIKATGKDFTNTQKLIVLH